MWFAPVPEPVTAPLHLFSCEKSIDKEFYEGCSTIDCIENAESFLYYSACAKVDVESFVTYNRASLIASATLYPSSLWLVAAD